MGTSNIVGSSTTNFVTNANGSVTTIVSTVARRVSIGPELWIPVAVLLMGILGWAFWSVFLKKKDSAVGR